MASYAEFVPLKNELGRIAKSRLLNWLTIERNRAMADFPLASIPATEVRTLRSSVVDQEYLVSVALPFHYHERLEKTYPVIYVLDANLFFGMVVEMVRAMNLRLSFCSELPDAIIVGIGYPTNGSLAASHAQVMHLRMRDLTPARDAAAEKFIQEHFPVPHSVASGGASRFLQFIHQELTPLIESDYRADAADRTLLGHSWGGLFALYALFHQPGLFQRYVVVSSDLPFDYEQKYAEQHDSLPVRMYLASGESELNEEGLSSFKSFISTLERRRYAGFTLTQQLIARTVRW
jgi:predicted alpha/beta superfamily hydrolase